MPLVTVTLRKPKSADFKSAILSAVHRVLVAVGVPEKDRFQRVLELESELERARARLAALESEALSARQQMKDELEMVKESRKSAARAIGTAAPRPSRAVARPRGLHVQHPRSNTNALKGRRHQSFSSV